MLYTVQVKKTALFYLFQATGGDKFQIVKDSVGNFLAGWSATTSWLVIPICDPEQEDFFGCHMAGNVMRFWSGEEDMKIPGSVANSSGCHIPPKPGSDLGPWNCIRWDTFDFLAL